MSFWGSVASAFTNNPYVIGYDPINEPFPANIYTEPELTIIPGLFDSELLQPLYKNSFNVY